MTIVGIMVTKNAISQGYPFIESIYSFLSWGDELYVADDSLDGTEKILNTLSKNSKIKLYKISWGSFNSQRGEVIGKVYNSLLNKVRIEKGKKGWVFEVQANEVFHEDSYEWLRKLQEIYKDKVEFVIPYISLHGLYIVEFLWRLRFADMARNIAIFGDAASLNSKERYSFKKYLKIMVREFWKNYVKTTDPYQRFFWYATEGLMPVMLIPVYRYRVLLPLDTLKKHEGHLELYKGQQSYVKMYNDVLKEYQQYKETLDMDKFWKSTSEDFCRMRNYASIYPLYLPLENHPKVMRKILVSKMEKYESIDHEELINKIISL